MIRLVEALNYRCLRDVSQELNGFQVLVGPNGSGKSTFLDVFALLGDLLHKGLGQAFMERSPNSLDLFWMGEDRANIELAVELEIPETQRQRLGPKGFSRSRYEVAIGLNTRKELEISSETLWLLPEEQAKAAPAQRILFPQEREPRESLMLPAQGKIPRGAKKVISKSQAGGTHYFHAETSGWNNPFRLGPRRLGLVNLPEDEERFPVAIWVKRFLMEGLQRLVLSSEAMRRPSPQGSPSAFAPDGSNLPWVVYGLSEDKERFQRWLLHVRTALPDVEDIQTVEREEDKHRYLRVVFKNSLKAPSWSLSDGTLRLLALTLIAYQSEAKGVFLIEEPENGIHPQAVETVYQSLSSAYDSQIMCASHSPVVLSLAQPAQVLCFARCSDGATDIVRGDKHPNLKDWRRDTDLGALFATGVLG